MSGFSSLKPKAANSKYKKEVRVEEVLEVFKFPEGELVEIRFLPGPVIPLKQHWVKIRAGKDKREIKVSRWCVSFDPANETVPNGKHCPYCELSTGQDGSMQVSYKYYTNAIIRDLQENWPRNAQKPTKEERKSGFIQMGSKTYTPVRVVGLTSSVVEKIQFFEGRNVHSVKTKKGKEKKAFPVSDPKYGIDIGVLFDNSKSGTDKYTLDKGQVTPLTEEELEYPVFNLNPEDILKKLNVLSEKEAAEDFKRMEVIGGDEIEEDEDEDEDDRPLKGKKSKSDKKSKSSKFDEDEDEEDEDEDEDDRPIKKKTGLKSKSKSKSKKDEDEDEDEEEDDRPIKKKKTGLNSKSKSSGSSLKKKKK